MLYYIQSGATPLCIPLCKVGDNKLDTTLEKTLELFVPIDIEDSIAKSNDRQDEKNWYVCGFASTPDLDLQQDIVSPPGIDIGYFKKHGWINYEHKQDTEYIIGVPTDNCYVDFNKGLYVEAMLFKDSKYAQDMWSLAQAIRKSDCNRRLGFSIEGGVRRRNERDPRVIEELVIKNVALTTHPANPEATWEFFTKSFETGHGITPETQVDGGALRAESLASSIVQLSYLYKETNKDTIDSLWKEVNSILTKNGYSDRETAQLVLQLSKGTSLEEAQQFINGKEQKG